MATFLEQSIEWQKQQIEKLKAQQEQLDAAANSLSPQYRDARRALKDAQANPATSPAELTRLQSNFDSISNSYFTARDQASANLTLLTRTEEALNSNLQKVNDPKQNISFSTPDGNVNTGGTTTASSTGQDTAVNRTTQIQNSTTSGAIPPNQPVAGIEPGTAGTDPARQAFLDANQAPATGTIDAPANIVPSNLTPAQQALLEANQADAGTIQTQKTPSREEQAFLDANAEPETISSPPAITREQQALLEANQADEGTIQSQRTPSREEQAFLEANQADGPQYEYPPDVSQDAAEDAKFKRQQELANEPVTSPNPSAKGSAKGLVGKRLNTRKQATAQDNANYKMLKDWRVRLALAPSANYLYKATPPGILAPLHDTDGVVFPYTPTVTTNYIANYDPTELVHSNYKIYQYRSSAVDSISIVGDFTAQDTFEANYLLATIHFFRSITKMFYGQDSDPVNGTPPPLCYLYGYGSFGFDRHPLVITGFTCTFPNDVDYIRATTHNTVPAGTNTSAINVPNASASAQSSRMNGANLQPGAAATPPSFSLAKRTSNNNGGTVEPTYVPTKMQININATPIVSRNDISRAFSLKKYATGELLQGSKRDGGGIW